MVVCVREKIQILVDFSHMYICTIVCLQHPGHHLLSSYRDNILYN